MPRLGTGAGRRRSSIPELGRKPGGLPLAGITVLDFSRVLAGPFATMMLADLGARVIKIEEPGAGDGTRAWGPPFAAGESAYFLAVNRGKESLTLNLKDARGRAIAKRLAARADVLMENFSCGQMARLGLSLERLRKENPRLVTCSITGFGNRGPWAHEPGYDFLLQAMSGLMAISGPARGAPHKVGVALADVLTGLTAATGILAALTARARHGRGDHVETSLYAATLAALVNVASGVLVTGRDAARYGNAHPNIVPYRVFRAADRSFALAVGTDAQFARFCATVLDAAPWAAEPRFATNAARVANRAVLERRIAARLRRRPARQWLTLCRRARVPAGPVATVREALTSPQSLALGLVRTLKHPRIGALRLVGSPLELASGAIGSRMAPPTLGQHRTAILRELDLSAAEIAALRRDGVV